MVDHLVVRSRWDRQELSYSIDKIFSMFLFCFIVIFALEFWIISCITCKLCYTYIAITAVERVLETTINWKKTRENYWTIAAYDGVNMWTESVWFVVNCIKLNVSRLELKWNSLKSCKKLCGNENVSRPTTHKKKTKTTATKEMEKERRREKERYEKEGKKMEINNLFYRCVIECIWMTFWSIFVIWTFLTIDSQTIKTTTRTTTTKLSDCVQIVYLYLSIFILFIFVGLSLVLPFYCMNRRRQRAVTHIIWIETKIVNVKWRNPKIKNK